MAVQLREAGTVPASPRASITYDASRGTYRGRWTAAPGRYRLVRGATVAAVVARLEALGVTPVLTPLKRLPGQGSIRQRRGGDWEGRYQDAQGVPHSLYGSSQEAVEQRLQAHLEAVRQEAPTVAEWAGLKQPKPRRPAAEAIITRTALLQLVQAVAGYLAGDTVDCLDLPMAAAHGALGGQDA